MSETIDSRLRQEIRQTKPFRSVSQEAALSIMRTADVLRRYFGRVVEAGGVTLQQYNVLRILRGAGEGGIPTLSIAERMIERTPGISRLIDRLVRRGLVLRRACDEDRRRVFCVITAKGLAVLKELEGPINEADDVLERRLSSGQLRDLVRLLDEVRIATDV